MSENYLIFIAKKEGGGMPWHTELPKNQAFIKSVRVQNAGQIQGICEAYAAPNLWLICIRDIQNDN